MKTFIGTGLVGLACLVLAANASAMTILQGEGSAVTTVDRFANFDSLTVNNTSELDIYAENGLGITTANQNWGADPPTPPFVLNPFHIEPVPTAFYADAWENLEWVTIQTTDSKPIYGLEFMYGNTWTTGDLSGVPPYSPWGRSDATFEFQEWRGGAMVDTGSQTFLALGTVVGFYDPAGFEQLLVRATSNLSGVPNSQALALDNLKVQLEPVPEARIDAMLAVGFGVLAVMGCRRKLEEVSAA
jgi:hypothetical protein